MSRDAFCKFYIKHEQEYKFVKEVIINKLKIFNDELEDYGHYTKIDTSDCDYVYWGKVHEADIDQKDIAKKENGNIYFIKEAEKKYPSTVDGIDCYVLQTFNHYGSFFDSKDFVSLREKLTAKLNEERNRNYRLSLIKNGVDFYKLDENGKENLTDDLLYSDEIIEELEEKVYMCQYMIDTLYLFRDMFGEWDDEMEVYIYIE